MPDVRFRKRRPHLDHPLRPYLAYLVVLGNDRESVSVLIAQRLLALIGIEKPSYGFGRVAAKRKTSEMRFDVPFDSVRLAPYLPRFLALVGEERWYKRLDQLDTEQQRSPFLWKIVSDYHWLEMAISHQADVLANEGRLAHEETDPLILAALRFAASVVEIHARIPDAARNQLQGRLRDGLNAESGFAASFLEADLMLRLMAEGYDVDLPDLEGTAQYDIEFRRDGLVAEVECKSLSVDAGRRIHRKDFYRFMEAIAPMLQGHAALDRPEILEVTLESRLPANLSDQAELRGAASHMLGRDAPTSVVGAGFGIQRHAFKDCFGAAPLNDSSACYRYCQERFGAGSHIAGGVAAARGCLVVMRSARADDTSLPLLDAMRKAASQLSGQRPGFIAVQFQDVSAPDLALPHLRRQVGILSYALFGHYNARHVNATYVCGFAAAVVRNGQLGVPAFAVPNPTPQFPLNPHRASPFLVSMSDAEFADAVGAPPPTTSISHLPI